MGRTREPILFKRSMIIESISYHLNKLTGLKVYADANPQVQVNTPCFFVQFMNGNNYLEPQCIQNYYVYRFQIDITYLQDAQDINSYMKAQEILDKLDANLDNIPLMIYNENNEYVQAGSLDVHRPNNFWSLQDLHYQFEIVFRTKLVDIDDTGGKKLRKVYIDVELNQEEFLPKKTKPQSNYISVGVKPNVRK